MNLPHDVSSFIYGGTFVLSTSGTGDPLVVDLRKFLLDNGAKQVLVIRHPFEETSRVGIHSCEYTDDTGRVVIKNYRRPNFFPFSYPLDLTVPVGIKEEIKCWFGFTNLSAAHGALLFRNKPSSVCAWYIDYLPSRFGKFSLATFVYEHLDNWLDKRINLRVELTSQSAELRSTRIKSNRANVVIGPIGQWKINSGKPEISRFQSQQIVYLGGLNERLGAEILPEVFFQLSKSGWRGQAHIVGAGNLLNETKDAINNLGLEEQVIFHGYVQDREFVETILKLGAVAIAPYKPIPGVFTETTDSAKLKAYAGAGLPTVTTNVTVNSQQLEVCGAAIIANFTAKEFSDAVMKIMENESLWAGMSQASLQYATRFDWNTIFTNVIEGVLFTSKGE
jgi:glycosyltransferase involved in cell wall biosynthesis